MLWLVCVLLYLFQNHHSSDLWLVMLYIHHIQIKPTDSNHPFPMISMHHYIPKHLIRYIIPPSITLVQYIRVPSQLNNSQIPNVVMQQYSALMHLSSPWSNMHNPHSIWLTCMEFICSSTLVAFTIFYPSQTQPMVFVELVAYPPTLGTKQISTHLKLVRTIKHHSNHHLTSSILNYNIHISIYMIEYIYVFT